MRVAMLVVAVARAAVLSPSAGRTIREGGVHIEEGFAPLRLVDDVRYDVSALKAHGLFQPAGPRGMRLASWCDPIDRNRSLGDWQAFLALWERLDEVRQELEAEVGSLLDEIEIHYVQYPKGGFYQRHVDDFDSAEPRASRRKIAFICYFTPTGWRLDDGGALRVFFHDRHTDIQPHPGSLVLFDSALHHEVLPTSRERTCLVGWFHAPCGLDACVAHDPRSRGWRDL